jgi:rhamnosyl/mannosyltransferase
VNDLSVRDARGLGEQAAARRLRVLCFGRFYDEIPGGMQRHAAHLFAALASDVDFVHLVPSRDHRGARLVVDGVPVVRTPSLNVDGSLALSPRLVAEAHRLHRTHRFDLIHLHFPDPMSHLAAMAVPGTVPRIITWHADVVRHRALLRLYRPLLHRALRGASAIIVPTEQHIAASVELSAIGTPERIEVIPFGFDLARFTRPHPLATRLRERHPGRLILALGRHVYYKGFDVLIRAMPAIDSSARLVIGGAGPLTAQWQALAHETGVADRVTFVGMVAEPDLPAWYQACDVFCLPAVSQAEAFGIVQLEAMACAKPVVSTRLNNGVDFVNRDGDTGIVVPPGDAPALAAALNRLLQNEPMRSAMGARGRERALGEFSLEAMGARTLAVYRRALAESSRERDDPRPG